MMALFFILSGIALGVLGLVNVPVWTILFMLILPLFLDIPSYLLGEVQNSIVDAAGREDNRAELLSVFNMGVNVTEIFYLFGSSLLVSAGSTACFVILGAFMTVVGIGICLSVKSAWLLSLQRKKERQLIVPWASKGCSWNGLSAHSNPEKRLLLSCQMES